MDGASEPPLGYNHARRAAAARERRNWKEALTPDPAQARWSLRVLFLAALIGCVALLPPELHPSGLELASALAAGAGILVLFPPRNPLRFQREWRGVASIVLVYCLAAVAASSQPHRSLSVLMGAGLSFLAFAAARAISEDREADRERILMSVIATGALVAAWGIHQRLFGLADTARRLRSLGQPEMDPHILRAESGRAFGPFLLPSSLGIYLAMALPLTCRALLRSRGRGRWRIVVAALLLVQVAGLAATLSGGAAGSLMLAAAFLVSHRPSKRIRPLVALAILSLAAVAGFTVLRAGEGLTPLQLRAANWLAAWRIFSRAPLMGVGFGNFGDAYARLLSPGMNETAYVHNSYLQAAAEGGLLAFAWVLAGSIALVAGISRALKSVTERWDSVLLSIPPVAFLLHNLVDFSAYQPSLSVTFGALAGAALARGGAGSGPAEPRRDPGRAFRMALLVLILGLAGWGWREAATRLSLESGRSMAEQGRIAEGTKLIRRAARKDPGDPDPPALLSEIALTGDAGISRTEGAAAARRAVELRPERAFGHYVLALYAMARGDPADAWVEIASARRKYPARELYAREEERLRALLTRGGAPEKAVDDSR
ncbi:MAG TPA: O-antigen ligase family protein [Candidatus Polarisedimenticolia bacterium]|jgi:O-antigen ligase|nr:O-antigen ligase family protein [Candidatus Polarisedimenticolia bacterium]